MPPISETTLQRVLAATDIVELVGRHVKLKRVGSFYSGLCPFHEETGPSFAVFPERQRFHCFGCEAGGTTVGFLMKQDWVPSFAAVKRLAEEAGLPWVPDETISNVERGLPPASPAP